MNKSNIKTNDPEELVIIDIEDRVKQFQGVFKGIMDSGRSFNLFGSYAAVIWKDVVRFWDEKDVGIEYDSVHARIAIKCDI
ncbi:hypothetical protein AYI69_g5047 [Smittium culicis]|uniref:Uncharacterized protein n=1 Tax=Smittium culicis TaxID=133412 RepID=A0A1R1Y8M1_9FUNG|nr:hypothetical protein AYI69_g5047 [Smittium culicis]